MCSPHGHDSRKTGTNILFIAGNSPDFAGGALVEAGNLTISGTLSNNLGVHAIGGGVTLTGTLRGAGLTNDNGTFIVASERTWESRTWERPLTGRRWHSCNLYYRPADC